MSVPLISRESAITRLTEMGCQQVNVYLEDHTVWVTSWGFHFIVPHPPPEGMLSAWDFNRIVQQVASTKPTAH